MALVQRKYVQDEDGGSSASAQFDSAVTAGNLLVGVFRVGNTRTTNVVTSTGGSTWTQDAVIAILGDWTIAICHLANAPAGTTTVTCTSNAADAFRLNILEFNGVPTTTTVQDTATNDGSGSTISAGTVTVTDGALLVCGAASDSDEFKSAAPTPGSGYTLVDFGLAPPNDPDKTEVEYRTVSSSGNYTGTFTGINCNWGAVLVAFATESGSPPTGTITLSVR